MVSVVMPVYNAMPHLDESILSVLGQTYAGFEFVIRDDGSTDGSRDVLRAWAARDDRIRLSEGTKRLGPAGNSNWVVREAAAPLVARMDADDICHPDRLRRQVEVFLTRPEVNLVGTLWVGIDGDGRVVRPPDRWRLARRSAFAPFAHGSIMMRADAFQRVGGYREACVFWEDLDLYLRLGHNGQIAVLAEPLYRYRHTERNSRLNGRDEVEAALDLMYRCIARYEDGTSYEPLLRAHTTRAHAKPPDAIVSSRAIVSVASMQLWAGDRPAVLRRMWRGATVSRATRSLPSLIWAAWASLHPATLRSSLRVILKVRSGAVWHRIRNGRVYVWAPGEGARPLERSSEPRRPPSTTSASAVLPSGTP